MVRMMSGSRVGDNEVAVDGRAGVGYVRKEATESDMRAWRWLVEFETGSEIRARTSPPKA